MRQDACSPGRILGRCALILACQVITVMQPAAAAPQLPSSSAATQRPPSSAAPQPSSSILQPIDEAACKRLKEKHVLSPSAPVRCDQLAIVRFSHIDFDGEVHDDGMIMVMVAAASHVQAVFDALLERRFPIARARLMDTYQGDDAVAMRDNNTSGFNDRPITGGGAPSLHAYGLAIDLNPVQNPYIRFNDQGLAAYSPPAGRGYANRFNPRPAKPPRLGMAEDAMQIFADHGFVIWGGYWDSPIDYQHFQVPRRVAEKLAALPANEGRRFYDRYVENLRACLREHASTERLQALMPCAAHSHATSAFDDTRKK